jgi:hypothetical protein
VAQAINAMLRITDPFWMPDIVLPNALQGKSISVMSFRAKRPGKCCQSVSTNPFTLAGLQHTLLCKFQSIKTKRNRSKPMTRLHTIIYRGLLL